mmetsp:Transcript_21521/g.26624  ORF Transcript_21521/g.26624 Transcript_21521/m.26624 type:complete len:215 (-) Transcript_21521:32-676(-)|eukprot:CAMPEP_0172486546 /NCGR_PEP_ID=MMETSP1066-20121228/15163_1 /TAXON_ID=671091 /ORGANISM="Coscinodiscus wailesii, Strain CCMP2513" /LENGTH=214 /DNA_ID=CAMNT_0013252567 /DNA_START=582 /DNA_END=1226 /DNA_ORIENTATION=-
MTDWAFDVVDTDKSGDVDKKELYAGLLLIHINLATYAGPAACKPMTREMVDEVFDKMDVDSSGTLNRGEFQEVMMILCSQIFSRVIMQWSLTLLIVPMVAQYCLDLAFNVIECMQRYATQMDVLVEMTSFLYGRILQMIATVSILWDQYSPPLIKKIMGHAKDVIDIIPDDVWETFPVTLVSCIMGCMVVPYTILRIDGFFSSLADKKSKKKYE